MCKWREQLKKVGEVFSVENFTSYQEMIEQFEEEIQEFII
jgi:hypothetical protein